MKLKVLNIEARLAIRSPWTWGAVAVLAALLAYTLGYAVPSIMPIVEANEYVRELMDPAAFKEWLKKDPDAADGRSAIAGVQPAMALDTALGVFGLLGPILAIVWGASAIGSEFGRRTVRVRAAIDGWSSTVLAKLLILTAGMLALAVAILPVAFAAGYYSWVSLIEAAPHVALIAPTAPIAPLWVQVPLVVLGCITYGVLGALIALVTRSTAAGAIIGFAIPYLEQQVGQWWLPQQAHSRVLVEVIRYEEVGMLAPPPSVPPIDLPTAVAVLLFWLSFFVVTSLVIAKRQEI